MAYTGGAYAVGDWAEFGKTITETDVTLFTGISGDFNPFHIDEVASQAGPFGGRIAHGMLTSSLICTVLGMRLPGPGTIHLEQTLRFRAPVRPGDTITARVEVLELLPRNRMRLFTQCRRHDGVVAVEGEALVIAPKPAAAG
jgi:3-hydroxybutyryl-CoA dehydratase